jgi:hypothetical protein
LASNENAAENAMELQTAAAPANRNGFAMNARPAHSLCRQEKSGKASQQPVCLEHSVIASGLLF